MDGVAQKFISCRLSWRLQPPADGGEECTGDEEPKPDNDIGFESLALPFRIGERHASGGGEVVDTKGGNHRTLKDWKAQWGSDEVETWATLLS